MALIDGLISAYLLDEDAANTAVVDAHGNNDGTASTNTSNLASSGGKFGEGFDFTRASSEDVALPIPFDVSGGVTLHAWINPKSDTGNQEILSNYNGATKGVLLYTTSANNIVFSYFVGGSNFQASYAFGSSLAAAGDIMVTATFDGTNGKLYVNGVLRATTSSAGTLDASLTNMRIGSRPGGSNFSDALMTQPLIFGVGKVQADIDELWASGNGLSYPFTTATTRLIKIGGTFVAKPILTKVGGVFVDKQIKVKVGGTFQDA